LAASDRMHLPPSDSGSGQTGIAPCSNAALDPRNLRRTSPWRSCVSEPYFYYSIPGYYKGDWSYIYLLRKPTPKCEPHLSALEPQGIDAPHGGSYLCTL